MEQPQSESKESWSNGNFEGGSQKNSKKVNAMESESRRVLARLLAFTGYPAAATEEHLRHFDTLVGQHLGPSPSSDLSFKSSLTYDQLPVELSVCWSSRDKPPGVRYCIEPLGHDARELRQDAVRCNMDAARAFVKAEEQLWGSPGSSSSMARVMLDRLVWHGSKAEMARPVAVESQIFLGWDLARAGSGSRVGKAYFLPHVLSRQRGVSPTSLLSSVAPSLGCDGPLAALLAPMASLPAQLRPKLVIVACDLRGAEASPSPSRIKAYFRLAASDFPHILHMLGLGAEGPLPAAQVDALAEFWECVTGSQPPGYGDVDAEADAAATGPWAYPLVYYDLQQGPGTQNSFFVKSSKLQIPVRCMAPSDAVVATGLQHFLSRRGYQGWQGYTEAVAQLAANGRSLHARAGLHTFVTCHFKNAQQIHPEITSYLQPDPELFSHSPPRLSGA